MQNRLNWTGLLIALGIVLLIQNALLLPYRPEPIEYSDFMRKVKSHEITHITVTADRLKGRMDSGDSQKSYVTNRIEPELVAILDELGVSYTRTEEQTYIRDILSWVIPPLIFVTIWIVIMRMMANKTMGGSLVKIGESKVKVYMEKNIKVTFDDVAGVDEAKEELQEIVHYLADDKQHTKLGGRMPKGVLLVGPPGTGKTLLARAMAGEAKVPFFSISGSEFVEMFVGVGAARVRDLFEQARKNAPCIIFIDELDALGKARGQFRMGGGNDEKEQTLNQLLAELDGFDGRDGIVILAATNRPEILDPALLRAGRFDRQVLVDRPDKKGRVDILKVHLKKVVFETNLDMESIAALTTGFTGADLANLVNEAALLATRKQKASIDADDFTEAIERIIAGLEKRNRLLNQFERKVVAHHEMGHALALMGMSKQEAVHKVSIIPRGIGSLGYTIQRPTEDRFLLTKPELENKICVLLAGRAAEELVFNHLSTGANDDLARATDIARRMICEYGMDAELGHISYESEKNPYLEGALGKSYAYSEETSHQIDRALRRLIQACYERALSFLKKNEALLRQSADRLLEVETLGQAELKDLSLKIEV
jgi:cell division protease FtsH